MSGYSQYYIPKRLDDPERIGFWTMDEALSLVGPFAIGIMFQATVAGLVGAALCYFALKKVKGSDQPNAAMYAVYWHLPSRLLQLRFTLPSSTRTLAG